MVQVDDDGAASATPFHWQNVGFFRLNGALPLARGAASRLEKFCHLNLLENLLWKREILNLILHFLLFRRVILSMRSEMK